MIRPRGIEIVETPPPAGFDVNSSTNDYKEIDMSNTSEVDVAAIQASSSSSNEDDAKWDELWPGFLGLEYIETVLAEGDCLYIPIGWWHYVRGLEGGVSVSFWWK
ncbi:Lysine-specific demethylase 8 [Ascosphaera aggregata]|nr:Lysine-specific demethylase 8 [Ascosphaera aggregata]